MLDIGVRMTLRAFLRAESETTLRTLATSFDVIGIVDFEQSIDYTRSLLPVREIQLCSEPNREARQFV